MKSVKAEIITIGDELLIGQVVDTNSAFIGKQLNDIGVSVHQITSIQDEKNHILTSLKEAEDRADIIIVTGGLGPTKDDVTKQSFCEYFNDVLVENPQVLDQINHLFLNVIGKQPLPSNLTQALVPSKAIVLQNGLGTAPGMLFKKESKLIFSLPGVPYEMKALLTEQALEIIQKEFKTPFIYHRTILTEGLGETVIADRIIDFEDNLPSNVSLAYLPNLNTVRLRVTGKGTDEVLLKEQMDSLVDFLIQNLSDVVVGTEDDTLELSLVNLLKKKNQTISLAESCTGGLIASTLTTVPGVSSVFKGSMVTYQTQTKTEVLGVEAQVIEENSVVSKEVAEQMALAVKKQFQSDYAIATTGNAGPTKGDSDAEIGTVFIAIASPNNVLVEEFNFGKNRFKVVNKAKNKALELLRKEIIS